MGVLGSGCIVGMGILVLRRRENLIFRKEDELGVRIDESLDQPWARDPVDVGVLPRDPPHDSSLRWKPRRPRLPRSVSPSRLTSEDCIPRAHARLAFQRAKLL